MNADSIDPNAAYIVGGKTLKRILKRRVDVVKEHLSMREDGDKTVIGFAHEKQVFYITNGGHVGTMFIPARESAPPT